MTTKKGGPKARAVTAKLGATEPIETSFAEVVGLIEQARLRAYQAINTELVGLYWQIGQHISGKLAAAEWGEGVVDRLAQHLARTVPGILNHLVTLQAHSTHQKIAVQKKRS